MNGTGRTIARNASVLMASQLITWALALLLTIFLPRYLGVTAMGKLQLAISLWAIIAIIVGFGMDVLVTKEIARRPDQMTTLLGTSVVLRTILYVAGFVAMGLYAYLAGYPEETIAIIYVIGIAQLFAQYSSVGRAALQGLERMEYISLADIASKAVGTVVSIVLLLMGYGVLAIAAVFIGITLTSFLIQFFYLSRIQRLRPSFDWEKARWMLQGSLPYLMTSIFLVVYTEIDIVIISLLVNEDGVGWYGAVERLFGTFLFIPSVFMTAVFPTLSRMYADSPSSLPKLMRKSFDLLLILGIPMGLGLAVVANPLVVMLYGPEFAKSGPILAVIGIVLIFTYQNMLLGQFLISTERQNAWTVVMAVATVATIPLDLFLIPLCAAWFDNGAIGGALAFVVTESGMVIAGLYLLPRGSLGRANAWLAVRALLAGAGMVATVWWWRHAFIAIPIAIGAVTYLALILALRVVPKEDWLLLQSIATAVAARVRQQRPEPSRIGG